MIAQQIDLSNYDVALVQSTQGRAGTPDGNVYFDTSGGTIEYIRQDEVANIDLHGGRSTGALALDVNSTNGTFTRAAGSFLSDGFKPNMVIVGSNFTNAGNNARFEIDTVTALVITVKDSTGMVTETGGGDEQLDSHTTGPIQINVVASAGTFTRVSGSFIDDGLYKVGTSIAFSGFTNGGNNVTKVIQSITATVITVTDNSGLADETGGGDEVASSTTENNPLDVDLGIRFEGIYAFENQERGVDEFLRQYDRWTEGTYKNAGAYFYVNSRKPATDADRAIKRGSGWIEYASDGGIDRIFYGNLGLGTIEALSQPYYQLSYLASPDLNTIVPVDYAKDGNVNESVQVYGDETNTPADTGAYSGSVATAASQTISVVANAGTFTRSAGDFITDGFLPGHKFGTTGLTNNTGQYTIQSVTSTVITIIADEWASLTDETGDADEALTVNGFDFRGYEAVSIRTYTKNYDRKTSVGDLGIAELGGYFSGYAVTETDHLTTNSTDHPLADVFTGPQTAPWTGVTLEKLISPVNRDEFNEGPGDFTWVLNNTNGTPATLDECVAYMDAASQSDTDIDSGAQSVTYGKRVGTWYSYDAEGKVIFDSPFADEGFYVYNIPTADQQRLKFRDDNGNLKTYAFKVQVEAEIGANAKADALAWYHSFFAANYNSASAVTVLDDAGSPVKGLASTANASNKVVFTFDYTGDTVGGPADSDKNCVFLCEGDGGVTQAKTLYTITKITTVSFACIPGVENNV